MSKKEREAVVFLNDHMKMARDSLSQRELGRLYEDLRAYAIEGTLPDLSKAKKNYIAIWNLMKNSQDKYRIKYEETCERNRLRALKRSKPAAADGSCGSQSNTIKPNPNKYNRTQFRHDAGKSDQDKCISGTEVEGLPGVVWA